MTANNYLTNHLHIYLKEGACICIGLHIYSALRDMFKVNTLCIRIEHVYKVNTYALEIEHLYNSNAYARLHTSKRITHIPHNCHFSDTVGQIRTCHYNLLIMHISKFLTQLNFHSWVHRTELDRWNFKRTTFSERNSRIQKQATKTKAFQFVNFSQFLCLVINLTCYDMWDIQLNHIC